MTTLQQETGSIDMFVFQWSVLYIMALNRHTFNISSVWMLFKIRDIPKIEIEYFTIS